MLEDQGNVCAICKTHVEFNSQGFGHGSVTSRGQAAVDHCHETGKVRGVLCGSCNIMLGKAYDDPAVLRNAAAYLEGQ